jgi:hypothetical protein
MFILIVVLIALLIPIAAIYFYEKGIKNTQNLNENEDNVISSFKKYSGVIVGALYGIAFRIIIGRDVIIGEYKLNTLLGFTFLFLVPTIVGIIPIILTDKSDFKSTMTPFFLPIWSICLFFLFAIVTRAEDTICLLIIGTPFLIVAGLLGFLTSFIKEKINKKKLYSIMLIPFLSLPIESQFDDYTANYRTESSIIINAQDSVIWDYLIEVPLIKENEYNKGLLNHLGIPRPNQSKIEVHGGKEYRVGYFSDELILFEKIRDEQYLKQVSFEIDMDKSKFRNTPTDQHFVNSNYFRFGDITYKLEKISPNQHRLILSCDYTVKSKVNFYVDFWANTIISDFENRLLASLKLKIEKEN